MLIGYARVSTATQAQTGTSLETQERSLAEAGAERTFVERGVSGARASRPELDRMLEQLREGDVVVVCKLDRLGRSLSHLVTLVEDLEARGVRLRSLSEGIDTGTSAGRLMVGVLGSLAEFERDRIRERTEAGRAAAAAVGRQGGRPRSWTPATKARALELRAQGLRPHEVAAAVGVSRATYYRMMAEES